MHETQPTYSSSFFLNEFLNQDVFSAFQDNFLVYKHNDWRSFSRILFIILLSYEVDFMIRTEYNSCFDPGWGRMLRRGNSLETQRRVRREIVETGTMEGRGSSGRIFLRSVTRTTHVSTGQEVLSTKKKKVLLLRTLLFFYVYNYSICHCQ